MRRRWPNVLVTSSALYLIDFDRGHRRTPAEGWRLANLQRLHRSLVKLGADAQGEAAFRAAIWTPLLDAYEATFSA
jgi:3-deoxy-D-manno-octulosonic acid kinase